MRRPLREWRTALAALALGLNVVSGCSLRWGGGYFNAPSGYPPQGTLTDPLWQTQEDNAEPSKFVVYQHEWLQNTTRLNTYGEDHLKQVAARINAGQNFAVIIERSNSSVRDTSEFHYPIHSNAELDARRREIVVQALSMMGVPDAQQRVVISTAITRGFHEYESERAYYNMFRGAGVGFGGFGGGLGGFGGGGMGGAGGGGMF